MEVLYRSTRGNEESVSASKAILEGLASDGGLFVPQALPSFDKTLDEFAQLRFFFLSVSLNFITGFLTGQYLFRFFVFIQRTHVRHAQTI